MSVNCGLRERKKAKATIDICLLGSSGVGKTTLMTRYATGKFRPPKQATVGADYHFSKIHVQDKLVDVNIWDPSGQEIYKAVCKQYYRKADGVLLVYDVSNENTFNELSDWLEDLRDVNEHAITMIVGNKADLSKNQVSARAIKTFADVENMEHYVTSAKTGENLQTIMEAITLKVVNSKYAFATNSIDMSTQTEADENETIKLHKTPQKSSESSCCCSS